MIVMFTVKNGNDYGEFVDMRTPRFRAWQKALEYFSRLAPPADDIPAE